MVRLGLQFRVDPMRVKEISVSRLFGLFNHTIPMKMDDRVTIITSPNGYGKTTILRLVHSPTGFEPVLPP